ncbi:MAG: prolyl aminopeptidase [Alphaproteobacteria bacterium]|nr:prolyl aminopeptidase [Alphaproteobacteria bacterium]
MPLKNFYPASQPHHQGYLPVDKTHSLFYEEFGNPQGIPVVYLHGGPGAGSAPYVHRFFDPAAFRIIVFDQRGCGRSKPHGETRDNSPDLLVQDLEALKNHLGIEKWHVSGGSWGSTLALLYAEEYPGSVSSLTLRGIWLERQKEVDWFINQLGQFFPDDQKEFAEHIPPAERGNLLEAYYQRLIHPDPAVHLPAAHKWTRHENGACFLHPPADADKNETDANALACARIETHFFRNHPLQPDDRILQNIGRIRHIPTMIVQGQYDVVCPPVTALELKKAFPEACLRLVIAGHAAREPEILNALIESSDRIRDTGSPTPQSTPGTGYKPVF